jgi:hypothetical protein
MAQTIDLYADVFNKALVSGLNGQSVNLPPLYQGDSPTFRIFLVYPTFNPLSPYTLLPIGGLSLLVAIGQKKGSGGTTYTNQYTWAPSTDPANPNYFIAQLPLNTAAITTAIGTGQQTTDAWLQIEYVQGGVPTTVLEVSCTINASVIQNGGVVVPPGLTPVSAEYVNATFLTRNISGGFYMSNPNTGKQVFVYLGDDNTVHFDPVN